MSNYSKTAALIGLPHTNIFTTTTWVPKVKTRRKRKALNPLSSMAVNGKEGLRPGTFDEGFSAIKDGWFTELGGLWPGQGLSLKVKEVLFKGKSKFQDVAVFESESNGRVLVLDGVIQCTLADEFAYQEMIAHLPLCSLKEPAKRVLVVGGGDGGVLREISRHPSVERIDIAEIDEMVIKIAKEFFPQMAVGFDDQRVHVNVCDGIKFVEEAQEGTYDVIIVDSSDPVGPAEALFEKSFFEMMHRALKPGGVVCTQAESIWLHMKLITDVTSACSKIFSGGSTTYAHTCIPTYPSGQIGVMLCFKSDGGPPIDPRTPRQPPPPTKPDALLRYYNPTVHSAAFVLPEFADKALRGILTYPAAS